MLVRTYIFTLLLASCQAIFTEDFVPEGEDTDNEQQETAAAQERAAQAARETEAAREAQEHQRLPASGRNIISPKPQESHDIVPEQRTPGQEEGRVSAPEKHETMPGFIKPLTEDQIAAGQRALYNLKLESTASIQELDARANQLKEGLTQAARNIGQADFATRTKFSNTLKKIRSGLQEMIDQTTNPSLKAQLQEHINNLNNARMDPKGINNTITILNNYIDLLQKDANTYLQESIPTAQIISEPTWQDTIAGWWNNFKNMFGNWTASLQNALASLKESILPSDKGTDSETELPSAKPAKAPATLTPEEREAALQQIQIRALILKANNMLSAAISKATGSVAATYFTPTATEAIANEIKTQSANNPNLLQATIQAIQANIAAGQLFYKPLLDALGAS